MKIKDMPRFNRKESHFHMQNMIDGFLNYFQEHSCIKHEPVKISSGIDPSVRFIGSHISVLKPYFLNDNIPTGGYVMSQPCIRTRNLKNYEKLSKISYSLSDGLSKVDKKVNVACICGMGGDLVSYIIENKIDVARRLDYLILEANSKNEILRKKISDLKFEIIDEDIVYDKKKYYQIMKIRYNEEAPKLSQVEILLGPILIKKHNQIFIDYLHNQLQTIHAIMEKNQVLSEKLNNKKTIMEEILNETI